MPDQAKQKLILASLYLFAENGVDSVSLRMINRAAGQKNNSALHYHFGSKHGLIEAMDRFIQRHFDAIREPLQEGLNARDRTVGVTLRDVMEVFVSPYVEIIERYDWGYAAVRTLARIDFDSDKELIRVRCDSAATAVKGFAKLLRPLLPELSAREFKMRFNFVVNSVIRDFANYRNLEMSYLGNLKPKSLAELHNFHVEMGMAVLKAPARLPAPGSLRAP